MNERSLVAVITSYVVIRMHKIKLVYHHIVGNNIVVWLTIIWAFSRVLFACVVSKTGRTLNAGRYMMHRQADAASI